jgi:hypothetical protein
MDSSGEARDIVTVDPEITPLDLTLMFPYRHDDIPPVSPVTYFIEVSITGNGGSSSRQRWLVHHLSR